MKRKSLLNFISKTGYKRNSPHVRRPMNLIPSGKITMKGVDFPLRGIDNLGNEQMMYPGLDYIFPGDYVLELPMMQPGGLTFQPYYTPAAESTRANYTPIMTVQAAKRLKTQRDAQELTRRRQAIQASQAAASKPLRKRLTPENFAQETGAIGDKLRFFPDDPDSFIDEYLNPLKMIGDMASGLGRIPLNVKQGNYGQAAMSVATPLVVGATAGLGAKSAGQFVNNLANPLAGTGQFLTTKTPLKNAYKYNPWAFKPNSEAYYRVLGKEGLNDALESGVIRANPKNIHPFSGEPIYDRPYFSKGVPFDRDWKSPFKNKKGKQVVGSIYPDETMVEVLGHNKFHKTGDLVTSPIGVLNSFDKGINFYKRDWLRGYKEVPKPKTLPGSVNSKFQSEIDWSKWNPDTPKYPELINEYNAIEESTKKAGTWMKNPDGSLFQGTPEQFIQQQSSHFKKAFGNSKLLNPDGSPMIVYHGSAKKFDAFDPSKFQLGDAGYSGIGIYTTPQKTTANSYALSSAKLHKGNIEPTVYELYGSAKNPISSEQLIKEGKNRELFNFHRDANSVQGKLSPFESLRDYDVAIHNQLPNIERIRPWNDAWEIVFPKNTQVKSAVGNVGFFDMSNPNIYKAAAPISIGLGTTTTQEYQNGGPAPTYFGGTLPEVMVSSDNVPYPYYNRLTPEEKKFFNQDNPIGRSVRSIANTGKRGQTYNDLSRVAKDIESFGAEMTGIPGTIRFSKSPLEKLAGAGRTIEATILGSSPFITSPYNQEDVADFFDTMDAFGFATLAFAPLKTPLQQGIKSSGRYLTRGYGNLSTGNSFIPRAWRSPIENIDQPMSQKFFDETIDVSKLSKEDKKLWAKYQKDSGPYKIPGTKEYDEMQDLISRSSIAFPEGMPLTRMIGFENMTSPINKSGILDVSSPTSFSTGRGQEIIGNIAGEGNRRVVIPPKYAKKLEGYFGKNPYAESLDQPLDLLRQEKEVVGSGFKLKQIGKVKNELGGYDYIMKPINLSKPKQLPGSRTSNSIMRDSKGQIQFLDNETYQDALKTGILNVRDYILDPRYRNVVEANQQLANRLNMNRVLPIQKEMGNVGLYDARVAKVNQPLYIQDPRPLETKIIQGTNDGVQAQYSRNLDGSGYLTIPRLHDKAKIIKNVEHEALHHVYPNLGEGFPSFTPLETAKAKAVFKSSAELRKIEQANKIPLWYLDDVDELVPNSFDLAKDLGIKRFQMYPGKERFKQILDSYQGNKKFIKDALKLNTSRDYKRAWDMLSGVRVGYAGAAYLGYEGLQGLQEQQVPKQKFGGVLPKAQDGEYLHPQNPYGFATEDDAIYSGVADPVFYEKGNFTPRLTQQDVLDLVAGKKVVPTEKQPGYSKEDLLNAYREARDRFDKQEEELAKVGSESALVSFGRRAKVLFENLHRRNPKYPYNYYWFPAANTSSVLQQDDLKELGKIEEELNKEGLSDKESAKLKVKREKIMNRSYNPMMDFVNYHTNQSTIRPDGKRYISPELAMESIFRNSGRRMERQAGAYYSDRDFSISKKLGKFDYEKFKTDSGYRKEVTDEYLKIPGVRESLEEYMKSPLEYEPSFSGRFLPPKRGSGSYFYPRSNTINLAYHELIDDIRNEGENSSRDRINHSGTTMPMILDHEYSHLENEYLKNVAQKLLDEYTPRPDPIGRRIAEDDFYRKLNEVYPQQRLLEGLARNSTFVNSPLSENPRIKQEEGDNTDWLSVLKKTKNPHAILGSPIDIPRLPFARIHEESSQELMSDIKAIQEYMTANPGYKYDYTDPNSFFTKKMFNKLINDDNVNKTLSFYRIFDRYLHDFDKLEKLMNLTSNEKSTPSYLSGFSDVSYSKNGGELLNGYKRYIMGDYKPEEEKNLKNTYDKLNRNYYKKAKESGMTAPNYIMSML